MIKYLDINRKIYADLDNDKIVFIDEPQKSFELKKTQTHAVLKKLLCDEPNYCSVCNLEQEIYGEVRSVDKHTDPGVAKCIQKIRKDFNDLGIPCNSDKENDADKITIENRRSQMGVPGGSYKIILPKKEKRIEGCLAKLLVKKYEMLSISNDSCIKELIKLGDVFQFPLIVGEDNEHIWRKANTDPDNLNILLEAPNGYGKTTFLKSILVSSYCDYLKDISDDKKKKLREISEFHGIDGSFLCLYMECERIVDCKINDSNSWLYELLPEGKKSADSEKNIEEREFLELLKTYSDNKKLVFLFDGFDEMSSEKRNRIIEIIGAFRKDNILATGTRIIMATRPIFWSFENDGLINFYRFRISNDNLLKDKTVFEGYVKAYSRVFPDINSDCLFEEVNNNFYLKGIVCTPAVIIWLLIIKNENNNVEMYSLIEKIIEQMIFRYRSERVKDEKNIFKRVYEELAYRYLKLSNGKEMTYYETEWKELLKGCINKLEEDGIHEFDDMNDVDLGILFFTNLSLVEWNSNQKFKFLSPIFAYHLTALHILRLFLKNGYKEKVKKELDSLPPKSRYLTIVIASSLVGGILEDERFFGDFGKENRNQMIDELAPGVLYEYLKEKWKFVEKEEKLYIIEAKKHIVNELYGENLFNWPEYNINSIIEETEEIPNLNI